VLALARGVLATALVLDAVLVVAGLGFAPGPALSVSGAGRVIADVGLLVAIGVAGLVGPASLGRLSQAVVPCLWVAVAFAVSYDALLLLDYAGHPQPFNPFVLFVTGALVASAWAGLQTRTLGRSVLAGVWALMLGTAIWSVGMLLISYAFWGSRDAYAFWLRDGAVSEFHQSGGTSLSSYLVGDLEGAIFFHPLLGAVVGAACGLVGAAAGLAGGRITRSTR
jgi:hypothetical protein